MLSTILLYRENTSFNINGILQWLFTLGLLTQTVSAHVRSMLIIVFYWFDSSSFQICYFLKLFSIFLFLKWSVFTVQCYIFQGCFFNSWKWWRTQVYYYLQGSKIEIDLIFFKWSQNVASCENILQKKTIVISPMVC